MCQRLWLCAQLWQFMDTLKWGKHVWWKRGMEGGLRERERGGGERTCSLHRSNLTHEFGLASQSLCRLPHQRSHLTHHFLPSSPLSLCISPPMFSTATWGEEQGWGGQRVSEAGHHRFAKPPEQHGEDLLQEPGQEEAEVGPNTDVTPLVLHQTSRLVLPLLKRNVNKM